MKWRWNVGLSPLQAFDFDGMRVDLLHPVRQNGSLARSKERHISFVRQASSVTAKMKSGV